MGEVTKLHNFVQVGIPVSAAPTTGTKVIRQNGRAQQLAPPFDHPETCLKQPIQQGTC